MSEQEFKTLYLVRHAKSSWDDPSLDDRDRPLNTRGRHTAPEMGRRLVEQGHQPELIISSPANRARSTAAKIAAEIGYDPADIHHEEALYFAGVFRMCEVVEAVPDSYNSVMLVGHNPEMTSLLNAISDASIGNMPTCAIAIIRFEMDSWADLRSEEGILIGYDYPKGTGDFQMGSE
jgi:phosphohistidine phosphatase